MKIGIATSAEKSDLTIGDRLYQTELRALGVETTSIVWNCPAILQTACDAIVVRTVWDYYLEHRAFKNWVNSASIQVKSFLNSKETILWNIDKSYLPRLASSGINCVPSRILGAELSHSEVLEKAKSFGWGTIVIKPTISAAAFLTFKLSIADGSLNERTGEIQQHSDVLMQPYLTSIEKDGEVSLIFFNGNHIEYSHAVLKIAASGDFRVQSDHGGRVVVFDAPKSLIDFGVQVLQHVPGTWLFARVDLIDWKTSPLLSELEMIEPDLFLNLVPQAAKRFAQATIQKLTV